MCVCVPAGFRERQKQSFQREKDNAQELAARLGTVEAEKGAPLW